MTSYAIGALQLRGSNSDNVQNMLDEIDHAMRRFPWLQMIVLPELNCFGSSHENALPMPNDIEAKFAEAAHRHGIWLIPGSMYEKAGKHVYNTVPVISPDGAVVSRYRKMYPWLPYEEGISCGNHFAVFEVPGVARFGISLCYDMWFPETIRSMAWMGAEVILHPSLTSTIDRDAEIAMIRAHAAQNQCYFIDVNLAGPLGVGQSCLAGPGGEVIHQAGKGREIIPIKINLDYLHDVRTNGWNNLGQPLKSFRDSEVEFPPYRDGYASEALKTLGPLRLAQQDEQG